VERRNPSSPFAPRKDVLSQSESRLSGASHCLDSSAGPLRTAKTAIDTRGSHGIGDRADRIALVTGANKEVGFEVSRQLGRCGMMVYVGARDRGRGTAAAEKLHGGGLTARFVELDVLRKETIRAAAATLEAAHGRLDVLVNNAGIADRGDGPPSRAGLDAVRAMLLTERPPRHADGGGRSGRGGPPRLAPG
jgi:hypothetical protein